MYQFTGYLLNKTFEVTEAESPGDLYDLWKSAGDPPMSELRCWVLVKTPAKSVWLEVVLDLPGYFDNLKKYLGQEVSIDFRAQGASSPNTSPHSLPSRESETEETLGLSTSFSTLGISQSSSLSTPAGKSSTPNWQKRTAINLAELINDKDPFTILDVSEIEDPLLLRFPTKEIDGGYDILCVSSESFMSFIRVQTDAGKNLIDLELNHVMCKGGRELNFVFSKDVWMLSILGHNRGLPNAFRDYLKCSIMRENKLTCIKQNDDLWQRVLFWVSDFFDFRNSHDRLQLPTDEGIAPFMTPFYFSTEAAATVGGMLMPNTTNLHKTMLMMLEGKANDGALEVCASHDIAPVLLVAFSIKKGFHKDENFKKSKKKWIKKREKSNSTCCSPSTSYCRRCA